MTSRTQKRGVPNKGAIKSRPVVVKQNSNVRDSPNQMNTDEIRTILLLLIHFQLTK